ncbi:uncharacterized protein LOC115956470 [Quercus lobata]|uniref:uncharacterized protein LOC115956470 n=1 Tax=Quercus lobata TaxID=97700 RepID=UPI0012470217|nr:uncharacterized protein LOC115956470 [Quercus lobata]
MTTHLVSLQIGDYNMHRVLVDNSSSVDILYYPEFQQMRIDRERLSLTNALLVGFGGTKVFLLGVITLSVMADDYPQQITREVRDTRVMVFDNGKQFDNSAFRDFCLELGIKNHYSSPAHPQANGQVEVTNRSLLKIIKTRLEGAKAYRSEAVIPTEVGLTSYWVENYDKDKNEEAMCLQLNLVDEVKVTAEQRLARYQNLMAKHYNSNVRHRDF